MIINIFQNKLKFFVTLFLLFFCETSSASEVWSCDYSSTGDGYKFHNQKFTWTGKFFLGPELEITKGRISYKLIENTNQGLIAISKESSHNQSDFRKIIVRLIFIDKLNGNFKMTNQGVNHEAEDNYIGHCARNN